MSGDAGGVLGRYFGRVGEAMREASEPLSAREVSERIGVRNLALTRAVLELMRERAEVRRHPGDVYVLAIAEPADLYARAAG